MYARLASHLPVETAMALAATPGDVPSEDEVLHGPEAFCWKDACQTELDKMTKHGVYELVAAPEQDMVNVISTR